MKLNPFYSKTDNGDIDEPDAVRWEVRIGSIGKQEINGGAEAGGEGLWATDG